MVIKIWSTFLHHIFHSKKIHVSLLISFDIFLRNMAGTFWRNQEQLKSNKTIFLAWTNTKIVNLNKFPTTNGEFYLNFYCLLSVINYATARTSLSISNFITPLANYLAITSPFSFCRFCLKATELLVLNTQGMAQLNKQEQDEKLFYLQEQLVLLRYLCYLESGQKNILKIWGYVFSYLSHGCPCIFIIQGSAD